MQKFDPSIKELVNFAKRKDDDHELNLSILYTVLFQAHLPLLRSKLTQYINFQAHKIRPHYKSRPTTIKVLY